MATEQKPKPRGLVLKRTAAGCMCLHDELTGEVLDAQREVQILESPNDYTRVVVTFLAGAEKGRVKIQIND